jgi:hypothetical protein
MVYSQKYKIRTGERMKIARRKLMRYRSAQRKAEYKLLISKFIEIVSEEDIEKIMQIIRYAEEKDYTYKEEMLEEYNDMFSELGFVSLSKDELGRSVTTEFLCNEYKAPECIALVMFMIYFCDSGAWYRLMPIEDKLGPGEYWDDGEFPNSMYNIPGE